MKKTTILLTILAAATLTTASTAVTTAMFQPTLVSADTTDSSSTTVQTKALSKAYVVYGAGSSDRSEVGKILGATTDYTELTTTGSDGSYLGLSGVSDSAMISSVSLAPAKAGTGTLVNIYKYNGQNTITQVTSQQYAMAATMAGVKDIIINVTANQPVTGEAALAGVYKALATDGIQLDQENTTAANSLLSSTSTAIQENKDDADYPGKLTAAVTDSAAELAEKKQAGTNITINVIGNTFNTNLTKQGIANQTSEAAKSAIVTSLQAVNAAPISDSKEFVDNAKGVADTLKNSAGDIMAKAKDFANSQDAKKAANWFVQNIWNPLVSWVKSIFK
ncbi:MAG: DUF1002 domain-containing protein [Lactobacillaceae bacterium]|jgi:uncharacterized protein YpuA (DUF1002 family)|nr:DUF1002 domain-containing protein [Lactobacillaceae bacterium]